MVSVPFSRLTLVVHHACNHSRIGFVQYARPASSATASAPPMACKNPDDTSRSGFIFLPNVQDEPRPQLARSVLLGARSVTAVVVGSSA